MQISKKDLVRVIQEELSMLGENAYGIDNVDQIESELGATEAEEDMISPEIGVLERREIYEAAMGLGRTMSAMIKLSKAGIVSQEKLDTIKGIFDEMKNLYAESY
tara:strand:- start:91 stop:405 length:315 start_codon:yes stop_codon:yes gene_type:complete